MKIIHIYTHTQQLHIINTKYLHPESVLKASSSKVLASTLASFNIDLSILPLFCN